MLLSIDSSGLTASVAIIDRYNDTVVAEYSVNLKKTHSQTLLPMIDEMFDMTGLDRTVLEAVAVAAGPGSFTGLRIGAASAKGIADALGIPIVPVPTVDGLAYNFYGHGDLVCPIMDARRSQTYTGIYEYVKDTAGTGFDYVMKTHLDQCAISIEELTDRLNDIGRDTVFLGDGVPVFKEILDERLVIPHTYAPAGLNRQSAVTVGRLAVKYMSEGRTVSSGAFAPEYLRLSQAEREAAAAQGRQG